MLRLPPTATADHTRCRPPASSSLLVLEVEVQIDPDWDWFLRFYGDRMIAMSPDQVLSWNQNTKSKDPLEH
ncbi:hypothetical protein EJB05_10472 [Eragrostis curvula]|uniref:Uncharacterized protein n=1 Tax=Eragrostis curvula TaxID=38414 RepID=A0A5J9VNJ1_9POAL|nr:hypothetical protein EJB05_10472 [Eragrostis curvula]